MLRSRQPKEQLPEHSEWQHRLFYIIIFLMTYQLLIYAIASVGCSYRHVWQNQTITNDKACLSATQDTKEAVERYLTLVLALISRVPSGYSGETAPKKEPEPTKPEGETK